MPARILDGTAVSNAIKDEVAEEVAALRKRGLRHGLAVVLVGNNPASEIYVRNKVKASEQLGIDGELLTPPSSVTTTELLGIVDELNRRDEIDGILVQLPLPPRIASQAAIEAIDPDKDVDGFHPLNLGRLASGYPALVPCTPAGVMKLLAEIGRAHV